MRMRKILLVAVVALLGVGLAGNGMAGWKEDQAAMFERIQLKPGDKINSSNWEKVKDLLPPSMVEWVKKGDFIVDVGEFKWEFNDDAAWQQASKANAGKYDIGAGGEMIVKATGKLPDYVNGEPFPDIDWKNDPQAGSKIAFNCLLRKARIAGSLNEWVTDWVNRKGLERWVAGDTIYHNYWSRPDGPVDNRAKQLLNELVIVKKPYDLAGIVSMNLRSIDEKPDQVFSYIPSIRRVKRLSGATRSSPFLGTDLVSDDGQGWYGKNETMTWKVVEKKIALLPMMKWAVEGPAKFLKQQDGAWVVPSNLGSPQNGYEVSGWKGAPWAPVDMVYVPRMIYVVEATPKDPYYNYGKTTFYVDPVAGFTYKIINDKSGDYWKTLMVSYVPASWDNRITVASPAYYLIVDDKTDHASICNSFGKTHDGNFAKVTYNDPEVNSALYSSNNMAALSK